MKMLIMSSKGLQVVIMNVELVAVAVMSVDLLQLGLVQGLVPGLVQFVAQLVHVVLGRSILNNSEFNVGRVLRPEGSILVIRDLLDHVQSLSDKFLLDYFEEFVLLQSLS